MPKSVIVSVENPMSEDLDLLFERHIEAMYADTPTESIHMIPRADLDRSDIALFVMRIEGEPVAMGALKHIEPGHGEIKSMHVLDEMRGRGLARELLDRLVDEARHLGFHRLSLETGAQPSFADARTLYAKAGFEETAPFGSYLPDPLSYFMSRVLD